MQCSRLLRPRIDVTSPWIVLTLHPQILPSGRRYLSLLGSLDLIEIPRRALNWLSSLSWPGESLDETEEGGIGADERGGGTTPHYREYHRGLGVF